MIRRSKLWLVVAVLFTVLNFAGGVYAAARWELRHAAAHAALMILGASFVWGLAPRRGGRRLRSGEPPANSDVSRELADRLTQLEQSVDAVAIEVERIGEGQRFMTRVLSENRTPRASGEGAAEPSEIKAPQESPAVRRD